MVRICLYVYVCVAPPMIVDVWSIATAASLYLMYWNYAGIIGKIFRQYVNKVHACNSDWNVTHGKRPCNLPLTILCGHQPR